MLSGREALKLRLDLTACAWPVLQSLLAASVRGVKRVGKQRMVNAIFWRLPTGAPWADIPPRYGQHTTSVNRFAHWRQAGERKRILQTVFKTLRRRRPDDRQPVDPRPPAWCQGRSKGWPIPLHVARAASWPTPIHAMVDAQGLPISPTLGKGQAHDGPERSAR